MKHHPQTISLTIVARIALVACFMASLLGFSQQASAATIVKEIHQISYSPSATSVSGQEEIDVTVTYSAYGAARDDIYGLSLDVTYQSGIRSTFAANEAPVREISRGKLKSYTFKNVRPLQASANPGPITQLKIGLGLNGDYIYREKPVTYPIQATTARFQPNPSTGTIVPKGKALLLPPQAQSQSGTNPSVAAGAAGGTGTAAASQANSASQSQPQAATQTQTKAGAQAKNQRSFAMALQSVTFKDLLVFQQTKENGISLAITYSAKTSDPEVSFKLSAQTLNPAGETGQLTTLADELPTGENVSKSPFQDGLYHVALNPTEVEQASRLTITLTAEKGLDYLAYQSVAIQIKPLPKGNLLTVKPSAPVQFLAPSKTPPGFTRPLAPEEQPISNSQNPTEKPGEVVRAPTEFGSLANLAEYAQQIMKYALPVAIALSILMTMYAGIMMMFFAGSPEKTKEAQEVIQGALIGLFIIIVSRLIVDFLILPEIPIGKDNTSTSTQQIQSLLPTAAPNTPTKP